MVERKIGEKKVTKDNIDTNTIVLLDKLTST